MIRKMGIGILGLGTLALASCSVTKSIDCEYVKINNDEYRTETSIVYEVKDNNYITYWAKDYKNALPITAVIQNVYIYVEIYPCLNREKTEVKLKSKITYSEDYDKPKMSNYKELVKFYNPLLFEKEGTIIPYQAGELKQYREKKK